jgi:hypothetical protein
MVISTMSKKVKNEINISKIRSFLEQKAQELPVVSVKGAHVKIGKYYCLERNGVWEVYNDGVLLNSFALRSSALSWCVAKMQKQESDAMAIERQDFDYSKHSNDALIFYTRYKQSKDEFRKDLMYIRYEESEYRKNRIRNQLDQSIKNIKIN